MAVILFTAVAWLAVGGAVLTPVAAAASATIAISADSPPPPPVPSGHASTYTINFTCSAVLGSTCGTNPTVTIPLDLTSSNPATPDMSTWAYGASSSIPGLVASASVVGENYVIRLNESALQPGDSDTIGVSVTPPNDITPDQTTWSLRPSFQTGQISPVTAPSAAPGAASATAQISVAKTTNDGGAVYVRGNAIVYSISARCNPAGANGNLYLTGGSLADTLPGGLTFVSAAPAPTSAPTVGSSGTITWSYPNGASLPSGCSAKGAGTTTYQLVAEINPSTPNNTSLTNSVTFSGTPISTSTPISTTATRSVTAIATSPSSPGSFAGKSSKGPLNIPGFGYDATYAGHWITPINQTPSSNPGAAEGEYTVTIAYPASRAFQTDLADPVPCLDNRSGVTYASDTPSGAIDGPGSIDNLCQHPAFDPTVVQVSAASVAAAISSDAWAPVGIRPDGTTFTLTRNGAPGSSAYFDVPSADVGDLAAIELPRDADLTDVRMSMNVWGYGDVSLAGGDVLRDIATATAYPVSGGGGPVTQSHSADLYIEPRVIQLGVYKAFGTLGGAPGGTTALALQGTVSTPATLSDNVVLADLLPDGLSWANPVSSPRFTLTRSSGGPGTSVTGTVQDIANFQGTGRELIRVTFPASAFTPGFDTVTAPTNFVELAVPSGATTYANTAQLFAAGIGDGTSPVCGPGTTSTPSTFESSDPLDLAGDGLTEEDYCQWAASLTVPPSGGPGFSLVKSVQGDLDPGPKYSPGIGDTSPSGSGTYGLRWSNTGGKTLTDPVVYDILPYIGDTGVSEGQSTTPRGSQFAPVFTAILGSLPSGVAVAYSSSTNPCRPEVYANADNPGCADDWTTTAPGDPSQVKALRITATGPYSPGQSFTVSFTVRVPAGYVNTVAWNSAASDADYNGTALLPAEPPKVGLTALAPPVTPTVSTTASAAEVLPGQSFSDAIVVGNTGGADGTLAWTLLGPVTPAADGTCDGLDWSNAPTFAKGTLAVSGDGVYTTDTSTPTAIGCYSYTELLTSSSVGSPTFGGPATSAPGAAGETVLVAPPSLSTSVSSPSVNPGTSVSDVIAVAGTVGQPGTIAWELLGPVAPNPGAICDAVSWAGAAVAGQGSLSVSGDGQYATPAIALSAAGCYGYVATLTGALYGGPVTSDAGAAGEVVTVITGATTIAPPPTVVGSAPPPTVLGSAPPPTVLGSAPSRAVIQLTLTKTASEPVVRAGGRLRFAIKVGNRTGQTARSVTACDRLPAGLMFVSASVRTHLRAGRLCWTIAKIAPHTHRGYTMTVRALPGAGGRLTNIVTIFGKGIATRRATATVRVLPLPPVATGVTG